VVGWHASAPVIGREWSLTLYWRAYRPLTDEARKLAPYRYIRLLTPDGQVLAGCDGIPTAGRFPPPAWSPDVVVADKVRLRIGEQVEPGLANVLVGLQLESRETENAPVTVGQVMLRRPGRPPSPPCVTGIRIGPWARLIGYGLTQIESNVVRLDLYWRMESKEAIPADYHVFVHVIDGRTSGLVAQADAPPCQGRCPTSLWIRGDLWVDKHYITVSEESISASTPLLVKVGWYSLATGERVMAFGADGTELNDAQIVLADLAQFYAGQPCAQHR